MCGFISVNIYMHRLHPRGSISSLRQLWAYSLGPTSQENIRILMPQPYSGQHDHFMRKHMRTGERRVLGGTREVPVVLKDQAPIYKDFLQQCMDKLTYISRCHLFVLRPKMYVCICMHACLHIYVYVD